jgi:hypothetical protein
MPLQKQILTLESPPKKMDDWYEWATKLDHQWRRMMRIMGRSTVPFRPNVHDFWKKLTQDG